MVEHSSPPPLPPLSLVIPVFNEEAALAPFMERSRAAVEVALGKADAGKAEWVFVNDGSSDATPFIIAALAIEDPRVKLVNLSRNFGKEAALAAGLDHASGAAVIPMDVDLQDPPEVIVDLVRAWRDGAHIVNARRINRDGDGWFKRTVATGFYRVYNCIADAPIPENVGDFRLLSREAVDVVRALPERSRFNKGLFSWVGFKVVTVDYHRAARSAGQSKFRFWSLWNLALDGLTASTTSPLRVWTYVGSGLAFAAFGYAAYVFFDVLLRGIDWPGYASLMVVILMLGGVQLISFGIMGEYLGRIANEVRGRPLYVVESRIGCEK